MASGYTEVTVFSSCQVLEKAMQKQTEDGVQSTIQVKVASDMMVDCRATNEFGADNVTFNIKASEFHPPAVSVSSPAPLCCCSSLFCARPRLHASVFTSCPCLRQLPHWSQKRLRLHLLLWFLWVTTLLSVLCCCCCPAVQLLCSLQCVNRKCPALCAPNCL